MDHLQLLSSTVVLFHLGKLRHASTVVAARWWRRDEHLAVIITQESPFHPVDHKWPDQPGDVGTLLIDRQWLPVLNTIVVAISSDSGEWHFDRDIPVPRGVDGWLWCVGHVICLFDLTPEVFVGQSAELQVDSAKRLHLNAGHTASHLFSFAFNTAAREFWRPGHAARFDSLRSPNLDQLAIQSSTILPDKSLDHYRFGKSLTKAGFRSADFLPALEQVSTRTNETIQQWIACGAPIAIESSLPTLDGRREWVCQLPVGVARMLCGGTHLQTLEHLADVRVEFERLPGVPEIRVHTFATLKAEVGEG